MTDTLDHNDDIALVGEYALHLMDAGERRAFEARLTSEPELRILLREWEEGLVPLAEGVASVAPPRDLKTRIEATLFASDGTKAKRGWSWLTLGGGALVAGALALVLLFVVPNSLLGPSGPGYLAEIASEDQALIIQASLGADTDRLTLTRTAGAAVPGRVLELWLIAKDANAPVSLGVLPDDPSATLELSAQILTLLEGGTLAVSDEPQGGSPTGLPTGAVLAVGQISLI